MLGETRRFERERAFANAFAEFAVQFLQRSVMAEQRGEACGFILRRLRSLFQFARDDGERVRGDARMEGGMAFQFRHRLLLEEIAHRLDQFAHRWLVHHSLPPMMRLIRSISVSDERLPMAARSTERSFRNP